jgi:hypothetical protein
MNRGWALVAVAAVLCFYPCCGSQEGRYSSGG